MSAFRTEINIPSSKHPIELSQKIVSIGSCFSDNIGRKLKENKFQILANPFGVIFNPISIFNLLEYSLTDKKPNPSHITLVEDVYRHYDFHSDISDTDKFKLIEKIDQQILNTRNTIKESKWLIITLGTSFVFSLEKDGHIVSNCHKVPQKHFEQKLLTLKDMMDSFKAVYPLLPQDIQILFTVSPVRHTRNGLADNSLSKSLLRAFCHELTHQYQNISYFPSYEIMMDDLRDYRFYNEDMIHPSKVAIDYIWEKFCDTYFSEETMLFLKKWGKLSKAITHRPFNPYTEKHLSFLKNTLNKLKQIHIVDTTLEQAYIEKQIKETIEKI